MDNSGESLKNDSTAFNFDEDEGAATFKDFCLNNYNDSLGYLKELDNQFINSLNNSQPIKQLLNQISDN